MEDLVPLLIFIVIAVVNLLKFTAEKGGKKKRTLPPSGAAPRERGVAPNGGSRPPKRQPTTLEAFFEEIAEKLEPKPTELPDWPKSRERPDYMKEMEEFETTQTEAYEEEGAAEIIPMSPPEPEQIPVARKAVVDVPGIQSMDQTISLKSAMTSMPAMITNSRGMRIASAPILRSSSAGRIHFPLKEMATLRKAIIANIVFSPPRAYDASFDNSITK